MRLEDIKPSESVKRRNPEIFGVQKMPGKPTRERDLHNQIADYCRKAGWLFFHGSTAHRTHRTLGEPDFVIFPGRGRVLLIECKSATGKLRPEQQAVLAYARKNEYAAYVVRSFDEFLQIVTL